jgi:hypothetical protein
MNMTGHDVARFDCGNPDPAEVEKQFEQALLSAENLFGPLSGEVGLILAAMVEHYKEMPERASDVAKWEKRVQEIVHIYELDQWTP